MKIYDISQELFSSHIYPGDEAPRYERVMQIMNGDDYNLTLLSMCAHNGTHVDAPYHFIEDGKKIDELDLQRVIGMASVVSFDGELTAADIKHIMKSSQPRILFRGKTVVTLEAAKELNCQGVILVGNESQTIGPEDAPMPVHLELLSREVVLLEGIVLEHVPDGDYLLNAAPINLGGADGAPCRATLIKLD